ncbi:MAG: GTP 3',8-cyclase MoaA [Gallionellaceae bacterium]|jgi:cyclic pyranopterin phosphate synthase
MNDRFRIIPISPISRDTNSVPDFAAFAEQREGVMLDTLLRPMRDLRISVTDRCNLRCSYCMPRDTYDESHHFLPRAELLSFEEIERLANIFIGLGVQKLRITGGEPLLRRGIERLIEKLAVLQTKQGKPLEIALTTNGVLLGKKARALKDAGLTRVTVSLDGLSQESFRLMSDSDVSVGVVLEGIATAQAVGLAPVKINMVVKRNANEHEILPLVKYFRHSGNVLRFIEYMDVGCSNGWRMDEVVPAREIVERINREYPLQQIEPNYVGEVAESWRYADGAGEIGVIASVTQAFCHECSRARLATDGKFYTCLFAHEGLDLRALLRQNDMDHGLVNAIAGRWKTRVDRYSQLRNAANSLPNSKIEMSYIGG